MFRSNCHKRWVKTKSYYSLSVTISIIGNNYGALITIIEVTIDSDKDNQIKNHYHQMVSPVRASSRIRRLLHV